MNVLEIRQKLLADEVFVIEELRKVQTLYQLKRVIRYDQSRNVEEDTESVAEHIFGMHCLVDYFLPLEDMEGKWDRMTIHTMLQYHDIDEILTGDVVGYRKTSTEVAEERAAAEQTIMKLPISMQEIIRNSLDAYESGSTPEARFVKAIDKIEPVFHLYNEAGRQTMAELKTTKEQHDRIKYPHVEGFPVIKRFAEVMTEQFRKESFYHTMPC